MDRALRSLVAIALVATLTVPGAASAASSSRALGRETRRVRMADRYRNIFRPRTIDIAPGDVVKWVNVGAITHTATGTGWDSGAIGPDESYRRRFRREGTFRYRCVLHPEMTGAVVVA